MMIAIGRVYESTLAVAISSLNLLVANDAAVTTVTSGTSGSLNCIAADVGKAKEKMRSAELKKNIEEKKTSSD